VRVTVLHQGIPIGTGDLAAADGTWFSANIEALPAYAAIQPALRDAARALANLGFLPPGNAATGGVTPEGDAAGQAAFDRQREICAASELRDIHDTVLPSESLWLMDGGDGFSVMGELGIAPR
jgi:hypothetical protein